MRVFPDQFAYPTRCCLSPVSSRSIAQLYIKISLRDEYSSCTTEIHMQRIHIKVFEKRKNHPDAIVLQISPMHYPNFIPFCSMLTVSLAEKNVLYIKIYRSTVLHKTKKLLCTAYHLTSNLATVSLKLYRPSCLLAQQDLLGRMHPGIHRIPATI